MPAIEMVQEILEALEAPVHGPRATPDDEKVAGKACKDLCEGDVAKARALWKQIVADCGGYMPHAAAVALIRSAHRVTYVPDVEAPVAS